MEYTMIAIILKFIEKLEGRILKLEKDMKSTLWCLNWDYERLVKLTDRLEKAEAYIASLKSSTAEKEEYERARAELKRKLNGSTPVQCGTVIECTRNHICGRDNDPCNGWARTVTPKPVNPPITIWDYRPGCPCIRCLNFKGTEAWKDECTI
jgi:hypothetical protein